MKLIPSQARFTVISFFYRIQSFPFYYVTLLLMAKSFMKSKWISCKIHERALWVECMCVDWLVSESVLETRKVLSLSVMRKGCSFGMIFLQKVIMVSKERTRRRNLIQRNWWTLWRRCKTFYLLSSVMMTLCYQSESFFFNVWLSIPLTCHHEKGVT